MSFSLDSDDNALIQALAQKAPTRGFYSADATLTFANEQLAQLAKNSYTPSQLQQLEELLAEQQTTHVPFVRGLSVEVDGESRPLVAVAATASAQTPQLGDMSSMLYLRDHIQTARAFMELALRSPQEYQQEAADARELIMSALHLMSTPPQLRRCENVIAKVSAAGQEGWPHISLLFNDIAGERANGWRNKQDTLQMLGHLVCDGLERGFIQPSELLDSHKKLLGFIAPLLKAVGFPAYENSGSWEELAAKRTSVLAVEVALLDKIIVLSDRFAFLLGSLKKNDVDDLRQSGLRQLGKALPNEAPDYSHSSIKYRQADAALAYVLMYGLPDFLAEQQIPIGKSAQLLNAKEIEQLILSQLSSLLDPKTGGMYRYDGDSYQRVNFHTATVQTTIRAIKTRVLQEAEQTHHEVDLDKKQELRGALTPPGRQAAWTHPLGQIAAWAAGRALESPQDAGEYLRTAQRFFNLQLATVTGNGQWNIMPKGGTFDIAKAPPFKLPECYITFVSNEGETAIVPSPHTPLNWSSSSLKEAVGLLKIATKRV